MIILTARAKGLNWRSYELIDFDFVEVEVVRFGKLNADPAGGDAI